MIEIIYDSGKRKIIHDGKNYDIRDLISHLRDNGHERETVGFGAPNIQEYRECQNISGIVKKLFNEKEK